MTFKLLHCADLHLDSPFLGLGQIDAAAAKHLRSATFTAFKRLVDVAIQEAVGLFTISGDIYDLDDHGLRSAIAFNEQLTRLKAAGIPCAMVAGNHDPLTSRRQRISLPAGVTLFSKDGGHVSLDADGFSAVHVYGISYPQAAVSDNLATILQAQHNGQPGLHLALLHANVGEEHGHHNYAPCTISDLRESPFDAWLLGHVHERRVVRERDPLIIYPGNIQGRSIREQGPRSGSIITFAPGEPPNVEVIPCAEFVWTCGTTTIEGVSDLVALQERIADDVGEHIDQINHSGGFVIRWQLCGRGPLHESLRSGGLDELSASVRERWHGASPPCFVERLKDVTEPEVQRDLAAISAQESFLAAVINVADEVLAGGDGAKNWREHVGVLGQSPVRRRHLGELFDDIDMDDGQSRKDLVGRAAQLAIAALSTEH